MELLTDIIEPLARYVVVTFLATEVIKVAVKAFGFKLGKLSIAVAIVIGTLLSYGWTLTVLPPAAQPGFDYVAILLTGLIIAGASSGLFGWLKDIIPKFAEFDNEV